MQIETRIVVIDDDGKELETGEKLGLQLTNGSYEIGEFSGVRRGCLVLKRPSDGKEFARRPSNVEKINKVDFSIVE